jgi:hypothetical protein
VGLEDGATLGTTEGLKVGQEDGATLGTTEGLKVGLEDGATLGTTDGDLVGWGVVGIEVGDLVGEFDSVFVSQSAELG